MQSFVNTKSQCRRCTCSGRQQAPAAAATAVAAAAVTRQQHATRSSRQTTSGRQIVMRVRIDDLERPQAGPPLAGEALQAYMELEQSGQLNSVTAGNIRLKYGIKRGDDGRVQLRRSDGTWMQLKLDMEVRGTILLRSMADDTVWVLQTERLEQVDLSDDYLLFMLFADDGWEQQIVPIQISDEQGNASTLEMGEQQFKDYVGLIKTLQEAEQEAYAAVSGGGGVGDDDDDDGAIDVTAEVAPSNGSKK